MAGEGCAASGDDPALAPLLTLSEGEQVWGDYLVRVWRSEKNTPPPDGDGLSKTGRFSDHILTLSDGGKMSEWTLRCPQRGDGLTLPGARGRRSVKRLLTERGVPPRRQRTTPVGVYKRRTCRRVRRGNGSEIFAGKRRQQYKYFDD